MHRTLSIAAAKARFAELIRLAERGETILLTRHGRPAARLVPLAGSGGALEETHEPVAGERPDDADPLAVESRRRDLERFFEELVWPRASSRDLGKGVDHREREEILRGGGDEI